MDSLISVIVPVYKVEAYLRRCVDSVIHQTYPHLEILLVDDGSPDGCGRICDEYAQTDSRVRVIHKENGGLSSARNAGIDAAAGEYLAFLDGDDWLEPDAYEQMVGLAKRYGVKLVCGGRYDVDGRTGARTLGLCPAKEERISGEELAGRIFLWDGCDSSAVDKLYHRSLFETDRYPLGRVCEDVPVTYRIALRAEQAAMYDRPVFNYFHRLESITKEAVSHRTFHFMTHAGQIYQDICQNVPNLQNQARYLLVRSLLHTMLVLDTTDPENKKRFCREYQTARKELRRHMGFLLKSPWFSGQDRLTGLLLLAGIYRPLRGIYHRWKRGREGNA